MRLSLKLALLGMFLFGTAISGQGPLVGTLARPVGPLTSGGVTRTMLTRIDQSTQSMIHGTALDNTASPLPNATVRLRNLQTSQVEQVSTANYVGEFTFMAVPDVPYVVEVVNQAGQILAVGDVITTQAGEVAGALVSIPTNVPPIAGVFGQTAGSVVSAATGSGLTALESSVAPVLSPER
jgi:hypothetical protein